jgi:biopolymer transport protein ExbD
MMRFKTTLFAISLLLSGCGPEERKPIPVINITVLSEPGVYVLGDKRLYLSSLQEELEKIADENRRAIGTSVRAHVRIAYPRSVPYAQVEEVVGLCSSIGLDKVETVVRDSEPRRTP